MDRSVYEIEAEIEPSHWWFRGRRCLFARELKRAGISSDAEVLDIGSSTGTNLRMLRDLGFGHVVGLDSSDEAIRFCAAKGLGPVRFGDVCAMPFDRASFDLILATDIIEHVEDDARALAEIARVLRPGGRLLLTVPAFMALWGLQDRVAHHKRRYRLRRLHRQLTGAGLRPQRTFYFNWLLFVPIWAARRIIDWFGIELKSEAELNGPLLNRLFSIAFSLDCRAAPLLRPPFGVSIFVLAAK
jgi:SAM-dependent methyltransferase